MTQEVQSINPGYGNEVCYECHGNGNCPYCKGEGVFAGVVCAGCNGMKICPICNGYGTLSAGTYRGWVARGILPPNPEGPQMMNLPPLPNQLECAALDGILSEADSFFEQNPQWWLEAKAPFLICQAFKRPGMGQVEFCLSLEPPSFDPGNGKLIFSVKALNKTEKYQLIVSEHASTENPIHSTVADKLKLCAEIVYVMLRLAPENMANEDLWYDGSFDK